MKSEELYVVEENKNRDVIQRHFIHRPDLHREGFAVQIVTMQVLILVIAGKTPPCAQLFSSC